MFKPESSSPSSCLALLHKSIGYTVYMQSLWLSYRIKQLSFLLCWHISSNMRTCVQVYHVNYLSSAYTQVPNASKPYNLFFMMGLCSLIQSCIFTIILGHLLLLLKTLVGKIRIVLTEKMTTIFLLVAFLQVLELLPQACSLPLPKLLK